MISPATFLCVYNSHLKILGRHPCAGVKVAKLQMKLILAMLLIGYDYTLVDGSGNYPKTFPKPDRNDIRQVSHKDMGLEIMLIAHLTPLSSP